MSVTSRHLRLVHPDDGLPTSKELHDEQHEEAVGHLAVDKSDYPRFKRLHGIHSLAGAMAPEEVWIAGAQVAAGKSLLGQNLFDDLTDGQDIPTLYIGTEQSSYILKTKHACIRAGVSQKLIIKPEDFEIGTQDYELAMAKVQEQLDFLNSPRMRELAFYANARYVTREEVSRWIIGGVEQYGIRCVIVDHLDQIEHGKGFNTAAETTGTIQMLHDFARDFHMPIFCLSQLRRIGDALRTHAPPQLEDFANSAAKERIGSVLLGLWRPLRTDMPPKQLREMLSSARQGNRGEDKIYKPHTMGVRLLKDRLGTSPGKQVMLYVGRGGRLEDDEATTHGITTDYHTKLFGEKDV